MITPTWGWLIYVITKTIGEDKRCFIGGFNTREDCYAYLDLKKEQHLFDTGSLEAAEAEWGRDKFTVEYSRALTQENLASRGYVFSEWL